MELGKKSHECQFFGMRTRTCDCLRVSLLEVCMLVHVFCMSEYFKTSFSLNQLNLLNCNGAFCGLLLQTDMTFLHIFFDEIIITKHYKNSCNLYIT